MLISPKIARNACFRTEEELIETDPFTNEGSIVKEQIKKRKNTIVVTGTSSENRMKIAEKEVQNAARQAKIKPLCSLCIITNLLLLCFLASLSIL